MSKTKHLTNYKGQWLICAIWPQDGKFLNDLWTLKTDFRTWIEQQDPGAKFTNPSVGMHVIKVNQDAAFAFKLKYL